MTHATRTNIILIGFMACGKTRVGEMLAHNLGFDLIDIDACIVKEQQKTIKEIFATLGEAHFRALETIKLKELHNINNTVIVTGGGTPTSFVNQQELKRLGHIFYLDANFALILSRLKNSKKRPLAQIHTPEGLANLKDLFIFRRPIYLNLGHCVDVNHEDKSRTCSEIASIFKTQWQPDVKIQIQDTVGHYDIIIQNNIIDSIKKYIKIIGLPHYRPVIVTSDHLKTVLASQISALSSSLGPSLDIICINDGEVNKTQESIHHIHEHLFRHGFNRQTLVISLGGGTVGDVAGFAAATFMRGAPLIHLPTTLLSMVDSSIGGKTGIDTKYGKNLIGAFYNPKAVLIDPGFLATLPAHEISAGMAEVIKHGIIGDRDLFFELLNRQLSNTQIIERAIKVKADVVFCDPSEKNVRMHLNLGHTFGHALETVSNYTLSHGHAVAIGLVMATKLAKVLGVQQEDFLNDLLELFKIYNLPTTRPKHLDKNQILEAMQQDKKRDQGGLRFIVPLAIGKVETTYATKNDILAVLE